MRLVFMGAPVFAAEILRALLGSGRHELVGVYCAPDRPCGRGLKCQPSEVKLLALEHGLPVFQPESFKNAEDVQILASLAPDVIITAAYGLLLPESVLRIPKIMPLNVHASLLPRLRGAAPIQRAIMGLDGKPGDEVTGITIMRMVRRMDAGPILLQKALPIGLNDTYGSLHDELAVLGGGMLLKSLELLEKGQVNLIEQDESLVTYAAKITKDEAKIDWNRPAVRVHEQIRAMTPKPGAFTEVTIEERKLRVVISPGRAAENAVLPAAAEPGAVLGLQDECLAILCADSVYLVSALRPAGKNSMDARSFFCGYMKSADRDAACK